MGYKLLTHEYWDLCAYLYILLYYAILLIYTHFEAVCLLLPGLNFIQCHTFAHPSTKKTSEPSTLGKALVAKKNFDVGDLVPLFFKEQWRSPTKVFGNTSE